MKSLVLGLVAAASLAAALPAAAQPVVDARAQHQEMRINTDVRAGKITPHKAVRLERREAKVKRIEVSMRAHHGGRLTRHDKRVLTRLEKRDGRVISRAETRS